MKNVQQYFCSYDQTEELLKLGMQFMPMCSYKIGDKESIFLNHLEADDEFYVATKEGYFPTPLKSQAFDFFREKFKFFGLVEGGYDNGKNLFTYVIWREGFDDVIDEYWHTYEEAESACIDKLIEIAKQQ